MSALDDALAAAPARHPARLVVDLTEVTFLDSTGLSALAPAPTDTEVRVVAPADGMPHRAITLTGLHETPAVLSTRSDAVTSH